MANEIATTNGASEREIVFIPFGEREEITLKVGMVKSFFTTPTRAGNVPSDADVIKFMMLCKARELNPWVGDAYLTGYDTQNGPQFSLITAHQAYLKRAEVSPHFDGIESGVIVKTASGIEQREGDFCTSDETLLGGWARVYRKDRAKPFFDSLDVKVYSTGKSRWAKDTAGMIVKCAEGSALRKAFPSQLGGLYHADEMASVFDADVAPPVPVSRLKESTIADTPDEMPEPQSFDEGTDAVDEATDTEGETSGVESASAKATAEVFGADRAPTREEAPDLYAGQE